MNTTTVSGALLAPPNGIPNGRPGSGGICAAGTHDRLVAARLDAPAAGVGAGER